LDSFRAPDVSAFAPRSVARLNEQTVRPVTAADLVDANGYCAAGPRPQPSGEETAVPPGAAASTPLVAGGVVIGMTECEVTQRAGIPERVEIGSTGAERTAVFTYINGPRPGIYHFADGRLKTLERAPAPPAPPKPERPTKRTKPKTAEAR
jgi:hypothetical protein